MTPLRFGRTFSSFGRIIDTACNITAGTSDGVITFITEVPISHLGEVLYIEIGAVPTITSGVSSKLRFVELTYSAMLNFGDQMGTGLSTVANHRDNRFQ